MLTKKQMVEFLELENKATPGPWEAEEVGYIHNMSDVINQPDYLMEWIPNTTEEEGYDKKQILKDAQFIAQSRTIAPAAVRKLMQAMELLRKVHSTYINCMSLTDVMGEVSKFTEGYDV